MVFSELLAKKRKEKNCLGPYCYIKLQSGQWAEYLKCALALKEKCTLHVFFKKCHFERDAISIDLINSFPREGLT